MGWAMIMLMLGTCVLAALCGGLYDGWMQRRPGRLAGWSDAQRDHARIMSRYYARYGPTE